MMTIRFLGTGAGDFAALDEPADQSGHLPRARQLGGKNLRRASSVLISPDVLIDFHDDRQMRAFGIEQELIRHLFITHGHWDHFQPQAIHDFAARLPRPLDVYGNETVKNALAFAAAYRWDGDSGRFQARQTRPNLRFHLVEPQQCFCIGDMTVAAVQGNHNIDKQNMIAQERVLHYVFRRGGTTMFYGLDSSYTLPLSLAFLRGFRCDVAVLDATFGHREIDPATSGHQNFAMLDRTIAEFREAGIVTDETTIVASHISLQHVRPHDDIVGELTGKGIVLAYDGMVINV